MKMKNFLLLIAVLVLDLQEINCQNCRKLSDNDHRRTILFTESYGDGVGAHLFAYALMSQLRAEYNFDTFVSRRCREVLNKIFTVTSLSDVPVFEDTFCVQSPYDIRQFEYFTADVENLVINDNFLYGKVLWLWPNKLAIQSKGEKKSSLEENNRFFQGYKPDEHTSVSHHHLSTDYKQRMIRRLRFLEPLRRKGDKIFHTIADKMELKPREVTFVAIHNRRSADFNSWNKKMTGKGPFKKSYFYDAMDEMRDSYDNVAFLYVSDDMNWGKKNLKNKESDLFFVGDGDSSDPGFDLYLLAKSNHTITTRGAFSSWGSFLSGGEIYTEYGSIVPQELMDKVEEETSNELRRQNANFARGSELIDMGEKLSLFSAVVDEESSEFGFVSSLESWMHYFFNLFSAFT